MSTTPPGDPAWLDASKPVREALDLDRLTPYLQQALDAPGATVRVEQFPGGHSNLTYLIEGTLGRQAVIRRPPMGELLPKAHDMAREWALISALGKTAVPVPRALHLCRDESVIGSMFYVMSRVAGTIHWDPALPALDDGDVAERSLQPGTGTTEAFAGAFYQRAWPQQGWSTFVQGVYGSSLNSYHDYRPGTRFALDAGLRYDATPQWALLLQLNALWRGRDSGAEAEPADSGGRYVFLSPGLSWSLGRELQVFAVAQLPLYQYVNGVQLTAAWGATAGLGWRF